MDGAQLVASLGLLGFLVVIYQYMQRDDDAKKTYPVAISKKFPSFPLKEKKALNHNTYFFRFGLPAGHVLGLPTGKHLKLKYTDEEGEDVQRSYTPVSSNDDVGYFDLIIKVYEKGLMTNHLKNMEIGDTIKAAGPIGKIEYKAGTVLQKVSGKVESQAVEHIGMICGGTGITPMLQIVREIQKNANDNTKVSLLFANVTEDDILCKEELETLTKEMKNFQVAYTLDRPTDSWTGYKGFVSAEMMEKSLPQAGPTTALFFCGPPPMVKSLEKHAAGLDHLKEHVYKF